LSEDEIIETIVDSADKPNVNANIPKASSKYELIVKQIVLDM